MIDDISSRIGVMSDEDIDYLISALMTEKRQRLTSEGDPETLVDDSYRLLFEPTGRPTAPKMIQEGVAGLGGTITYNSGTNHTCDLYTIKLPDEPEPFWSWDDPRDTLLGSDTNKIGKVRKSVNLHSLPEGSIVVKHTMKYVNGRHERKSSAAWVLQDGKFSSSKTEETKRLPPPHST